MRPDKLTQQFIEGVTRFIRDNGLKGHDRIEGQDALGKKFKVSYTVVRKGLKKLIEQKVIYRVKGKGTFVAPREHTAIRNYIVIIPNVHTPGIIPDRWFELIQIVKGYLLARGYLTMVFASTGDLAAVRKMCYEDQVRGVLFFGIDRTRPLVRDAEVFLKKRSVPIVYLEERVGEANRNTVSFDHEAAGVLAAEHLIASGRKRIAIVADKDTGAFGLRIRGFLRAAKAHGIVAETILFVSPQILKKDDCVTRDGIAFLNEGVTYHNLFLMKTYGIRIPEDIAVIVIDGSHLCDNTTPPLSAVIMPLERTAETIIGRIIAAIEGAPPFPLEYIPPLLTKRKSS
ncbi:MAG: substrate-binding domain-containing protein [Spirochaetes bacterium]|nr:substrate-binding domain-containing protein [Spirochaetota bacterium]